MRALILSANDFEDMELMVPYYRLLEAGYLVDVAAERAGFICGLHGYRVSAEKSFDEVAPEGYAVLILPGGKAPASIRSSPKVHAVVRHFFTANKPVGAICHGPQTLISAGLMRGRRATGYRSVVEELREAGALFEDREVVVDGNLVTSRYPQDLPAFMREIMILLSVNEGSAPDKYRVDDTSIPFEPISKKVK